jgi:hypothetical protein
MQRLFEGIDLKKKTNGRGFMSQKIHWVVSRRQQADKTREGAGAGASATS